MGLLAVLATTGIAVGVIALGLATHAFGSSSLAAIQAPSATATASQSSTGQTPYPDAVRIPMAQYSDYGITIVPADATAQPVGTIVSQSSAESEAITFGLAGPGTTILGAELAHVQHLGSGNPDGLYWIVSVDPPNGVHSSTGVAQNFMNIFVNAGTGKYAAAIAASSPAFGTLPNNSNSTITPSGTGGVNTAPTPTAAAG